MRVTDQTLKAIGFGFSVFVIGLCVVLVGSSPGTQHVDYVPKPITICDDAPAWAIGANLATAIDWWSDRGYKITDVKTGRCATVCTTTNGRSIECDPGAISIGLVDGWFPADASLGQAQEGIVLVPKNPTPGGYEPVRDDVRSLILAHELGHAFGFEHVQNRVGCVGAVPNGQVMSDTVGKLGWGDDGIDLREQP